MLASMRKAIQKGLVQVVAWITVFSMIFFFSGGGIIDLVQRLFGFEDYVISVNGYGLNAQEYHYKKLELEQRISQIRQQFGPYAQAFLEMNGLTGDLSNILLKDVALTLLTEMIAGKLKLKLDRKYITKAIIQQLPKEMLDEEGKINMEALQYLLNGMSVAQLEQRIEESLKKDLVFECINAGLFTPSFIINSRYEDTIGLKKYAILTLSFDKYLAMAKKAALSDSDIKSYFEAHKNSYMVPEKRVVSVWKFDAAQYGIQVTDKEITAIYEKNKQSYLKEPAKIQLRKIVLDAKSDNARQQAIQIKAELLKNPAMFAELAKKYSIDKKSAEKGGLMDFVKKEELNPALGQAAFALEQDGQLSDIVTTDDGLEIVQRVSRKAAVYKTMQDVAADIKNNALQAKFGATFNLDAKKIVKDQKNNKSAAENFAQQKKAKMETLTLEKSGSTLAKNAFLIKEGGVGYFVDGKTGYIVRVDKIEKSYIPVLEKIATTVKEDIYKANAEKLLTAAVEKAKIETASTSFKDLSTSLDAPITITSFINSESKDDLDKLSKQGVPVKEMLLLQKRGVVKSFIKHDGFVIKVVEVKNPEEDEAKKTALEKDIYLQSKDALDKGFIASLAKTAKIIINKEQFNGKKHK